MRDPSLEDRFDWRSMTAEKWTKLLRKHPQFITRLPKDILGCHDERDILIAQPQLGPYFDLSEWNRLELDFAWADLLSSRPQFADQCDFSIVTARAAANLLERQPQFFDRIPLETLWAYHWTELFERQPQLEKKMLAKPHSEWPFNFWVHALQYHPELEPEFDDWDKIEDQDIPDFKRTQPEMYKRHWPEKEETGSPASKQKKAVPGDIVMAVTSENIEDVCKCVVWLGDGDVAVSGHTAIIHHNQDAEYLAYYFHSSMFFAQKQKLAHGTKVIEVTPDKLLDIVIPFSPFNLSMRSRICIPNVSERPASALITNIFLLGFWSISQTVYAMVISELFECCGGILTHKRFLLSVSNVTLVNACVNLLMCGAGTLPSKFLVTK